MCRAPSVSAALSDTPHPRVWTCGHVERPTLAFTMFVSVSFQNHSLSRVTGACAVIRVGQWLQPGARTSFPCAAARVSSLTTPCGLPQQPRPGRRSVLPPLDTLPRGAPPPRDTGSRTHSTPGAQMGTQGRVGGVGAGRARVEAMPQPPRPECAHRLDTLQPQHYRPAGDDWAVHAPRRVGAGKWGRGRAQRPLASRSLCSSCCRAQTRAPSGAIYNCRLFVCCTDLHKIPR